MLLYTPVQWLEGSIKLFEKSIVIVVAALEIFTFAPLPVFTAVNVPQHIRELRETANALVEASCGHVVPGTYHSLLDLWKEQ